MANLIIADGQYETISVNTTVTAVTGKQYYYKNTSVGNIDVTYGLTTVTVQPGDVIILLYDGTDWTDLTPRAGNSGSGVFDDITVNGTSDLNGTIYVNGSILQSIDTSSINIAPGTITNKGGNITLFAENHPVYPKRIQFRNGSAINMLIDDNVIIGATTDNGSDLLQVGSNTDISVSLGRGKLGFAVGGTSDQFVIAHYDNFNVTDYAFLAATGGTNVNALSGGAVRIRNSNANIATFSGSQIDFLKPVTMQVNTGVGDTLYRSTGVNGSSVNKYFAYNNSEGDLTNYVALVGGLESNTAGSESGSFGISVNSAGSFTRTATFLGSQIDFNKNLNGKRIMSSGFDVAPSTGAYIQAYYDPGVGNEWGTILSYDYDAAEYKRVRLEGSNILLNATTGNNVIVGSTIDNGSDLLQVNGTAIIGSTASQDSLKIKRASAKSSIRATSAESGHLVLDSHDTNGNLYLNLFSQGDVHVCDSGGRLLVGQSSSSGSALLQVGSNTNISVSLGRGKLGFPGAGAPDNVFYIGHYDFHTTTGYALAADGVGNSFLNAAASFKVSIRNNNNNVATFSGSQIDLLKDTVITGNLSKTSGSFRIPHPLKETHDLVHSFVEAPKADNIYSGMTTLIAGKAEINLDQASGMTEGTFLELNTTLRRHTSNESGFTKVISRIEGNILIIEAEDNNCTDEIYWQVIGERQDKQIKESCLTDENGKVIVEPLKKETK